MSSGAAVAAALRIAKNMSSGTVVVLLPDRGERYLSVDEVKDTLNNFSSIMGREPTSDEREFWKAVLDFKSGQNRSGG